MIVRIFSTSVEPEDVDSATQMFKAEVQPAFNEFDGCLGIDWYIGVDEHSGDLVDAVAISRWENPEAIEKATSSKAYEPLWRICATCSGRPRSSATTGPENR